MQQDTEIPVLSAQQKKLFILVVTFLVIHFSLFLSFSFSSPTKFPTLHYWSSKYVMPFMFHSFAVFAPEPPTFSLSVYVPLASGEYIDPFEPYLVAHQQNRLGFDGTKYTVALNTIRKCYYAAQQQLQQEFSELPTQKVTALTPLSTEEVRALPEYIKLDHLIHLACQEQNLSLKSSRKLLVRSAASISSQQKTIENVLVVD